MKTWFKPNGLGFKENINDSLQDIEADLFGLFQGASHPFGNPKELLRKYRPKELNERY